MSSTSFYWKLAHARNLLHPRREIKARKKGVNFCEGNRATSLAEFSKHLPKV